MTPDPRLVRHLREILGLGLVTALLGPGCGETVDVCIGLEDPTAACPTAEEAEDMLKGTETCTDPVVVVRKVASEAERHETTDTGIAGVQCCYEVVGREKVGQACSVGRPLTHGARAVVAPVRARPSPWAAGARPEVAGLSAAARAALADQWTRDAQAEHASIAAFARTSLELLAHGAPPELLARVHAAAADEVRHAADCFALASAYAGRPVAPGPLAVPPRQVPDLATLARETAREAAVGETLATLLAAERLARTTDPAARAALSRIVADEARHAALGWAVVRWARARGGSPVAAAVDAALSEFPASVAAMALSQAVAVPAGAAAHGLLSRMDAHLALERGAARVLGPVIAELAGTV